MFLNGTTDIIGVTRIKGKSRSSVGTKLDSSVKTVGVWDWVWCGLGGLRCICWLCLVLSLRVLVYCFRAQYTD